MGYIDLTDAQAYMGAVGAADEALLNALIERATALIDRFTGRTFHASDPESRTFDVACAEGRTLYLFEHDLYALTAITNGDGSSINIANVVPAPRNAPPYYGLVLKASSGVAWVSGDDSEAAITITGRWGYSDTPPDDIKHACARLAQWLYRQKDALSTLDAVRESVLGGVVVMPQVLPNDVRTVLMPYRRG